MRKLVALAAVLCAGCGAQARSHVVAPTTDKQLTAACGYYATTIAVALLAERPAAAAKLKSTKGRDGMRRAVGIADRTERLLAAKPAFAAVAHPFHEIAQRIDAANAALERDDLASFRYEMRRARAPLVAADAAARGKKLACRMTSTDGTASITMR